MKLSYKLVGLFLLSLSFSSCDFLSLKQEMAHLDQAFIPAYYFANIGASEEAGRAMIPLSRKWKEIEKKYKNLDPDSDDWQEAFRLIRGYLEEAGCAIRAKDTEQALFSLDHARYELMDIRWRLKMPYYLDAYWDLEGALSVAVETAKDPMLGLFDWKEFECQVHDLRSAWKEVVEGPSVPDVFNLSEANKIELLRRQLEFEGLLTHFELAVTSAELCEVKERARDLEPAYFNCLVLFGDFEAFKVYYANH